MGWVCVYELLPSINADSRCRLRRLTRLWPKALLDGGSDSSSRDIGMRGKARGS